MPAVSDGEWRSTRGPSCRGGGVPGTVKLILLGCALGPGWAGALFLSLLTPILGVALYTEHTLKHQQLESLRTEWRESAAPRPVFPLQVLGTSEDRILNHL